jgi:hypothetical protein
MSAAIGTDGPEGPAVAPDRALWVYGVVPAEFEPPPGLTGVDDAPIELVHEDAVAAVVSWVAVDRPPGRKAELLAFQAVLDRLAEHGAVAPVRFGTVLPDAASIGDFLSEQYDELSRVLAMLAGRRQYNLRAVYLEDVVLAELATSVPEIRELRERTRGLPEEASFPDRVRLGELVVRELEQRAAEDATLVLDSVYPRAVAHVERSASNPPTVVDVALLVDEAHADELVDELESMAEAVHERIRLELIGPMAPYDFAGAL